MRKFEKKGREERNVIIISRHKEIILTIKNKGKSSKVQEFKFYKDAKILYARWELLTVKGAFNNLSGEESRWFGGNKKQKQKPFPCQCKHLYFIRRNHSENLSPPNFPPASIHGYTHFIPPQHKHHPITLPDTLSVQNM